MSENFWSDFGNDLLDAVNDAVNSGDFSNLSSTVKQSLEDVHAAAVSAQQNYVKYHRTQQWKVVDEPKPKVDPQPAAPAIYERNLPGQYKGPVYSVLGWIGTGIFGITTGVLGIVGLATGYSIMGIMTAIFACLTLPCICLLKNGRKYSGRNKRFRVYQRVLGDGSYCSIEDLAKAVQKKPKYVLKDLRKMLEQRYFLQGHIDGQNRYLLVTDEAYEQYCQAENSRRQRDALEFAQKTSQEAQKEAEKELVGSLSPEVQKILEEGNRYIAHIHECNDAIPGEVMSQKLARLEDTVRRIFDQVKRNPASASELRKMMSYYLPMTTKLIDSYRDLDGQPEYGSHVINTKKEIEETLDTINEAFENLFDSLFEDTAFDISSDIATMKTMMAQEGLTKQNDFKLDRS